MPNYICAFVPGGAFFFTVNLLERRRRLLTDYIDDLRMVFTDARHRRPFTIDAIVVLPDHLHSMWTLPVGDGDFPTRWHDIKARFSARIPKHERLSSRRGRKGERGIWQRRFWEHGIRDEGNSQTDTAGCATLSRPTILSDPEVPSNRTERAVTQYLRSHNPRQITQDRAGIRFNQTASKYLVVVNFRLIRTSVPTRPARCRRSRKRFGVASALGAPPSRRQT